MTELIPVTIITGFLGSGKTTLLKRILQGDHGLRIAVIENEFAAESIDHGLLVQDSGEQIVEMNNGCICCSVRGDLIRILGELHAKRAAGSIVFDHVVINWESAGHPPPKVYDVPHFDFHFYLVSTKEQMHTTYKSEAESGDPAQKPAGELMPAGYILPPGTAVPQMGVHAVNPASGEFQGQPFTATFIYGFHNKRQAFLEPMVSLAFLQSKAPFSAPVTRPASYNKMGKYPSTYSVKYDESSKSYAVTLEDLQ